MPYGDDRWKGNRVKIPNDTSRRVRWSFYVRWRKSVIGKLRRQNAKVRGSRRIKRESKDLLWCCFVTLFCRSSSFNTLQESCGFSLCVNLWSDTGTLCCDNFKGCRSFFCGKKKLGNCKMRFFEGFSSVFQFTETSSAQADVWAGMKWKTDGKPGGILQFCDFRKEWS